MDRSVMIYIRKEGTYVIPFGITMEGADLHTEPFEYLPFDSNPKEIWNAVERSLLNANRRVPHPSTWNFITTWYQKAGVKSWGQFAGKAKVLSVAEDEKHYTFKSLRWERGSLISQKETMINLPKNASMEQLIETLKNYI